jgi:outer membrane protein W
MGTRKVLSRAFLPVFVVVSQLSATTHVAASDEKRNGSPPAAEEAQADSGMTRERKWRMRLIGAIGGNNNGVLVSPGRHTYTGVSVDGSGGVGINFEYRYSPRMGFEIGAMAVGGTVSVGVDKDSYHHRAGVEVNGYVPITFAFNYHPLKNPEIVDFFIGPMAACTVLSAVGVGPGVYVGSYVDLGVGANLGVDINFRKNSRWSFNTGFKYISNVTSDEDRDSRFEFDPLLFTFGFGFKF